MPDGPDGHRGRSGSIALHEAHWTGAGIKPACSSRARQLPTTLASSRLRSDTTAGIAASRFGPISTSSASTHRCPPRDPCGDRAKAAAAALGGRVTDHGELVAGQLLGLAPVVAAAGVVAAIGALGNDAFKVLFASQAVGFVAVALDVRAEGQVAGLARQQLLQERLALQQRCCGHVHAIDVEQVEERVGQRALPLPGQCRLEQVEVLLGARSGDEFAIQGSRGKAQLRHGVAYLGDLVGPLQRVAGPEPDGPIGDRCEDPIPVPLDLMDPLVALRRGLPQLGQLGLEGAGRRSRLFRFGQGQGLLGPVLPSRTLCREGFELLLVGFTAAGPPDVCRWGRRHIGEQIVRFQIARIRIVVLEQQPLRLTGRFAGPDQVPPAFELGAEQLESQVTLGKLCLWVSLGGPNAVIKLGHVPTAVLPLGDLAFEASVVDGMVFHFDRHPFDLGVVARALGDGPTLQGVADLQPEVVVPAAGVVKLDHENGALPLRQRFARLGLVGLVKAALATVFDQGHDGATLLAQVLANGRSGGANGFDSGPDLIDRHAQRLGPILQLVVFVDVDAVAVRAAGVLLVVAHGILLG
uniref:PE-PGRS family protein n=1 Tax=Heterorhabditis bacteriophora TaxID=37862 RepID=A0A1I7WBY1_HETBA